LEDLIFAIGIVNPEQLIGEELPLIVALGITYRET
jgi:hypothetical protein